MLDGRAFAYYDVAKKQWAINAGKFAINVGDSIESPLKGAVSLTRGPAWRSSGRVPRGCTGLSVRRASPL